MSRFQYSDTLAYFLTTIEQFLTLFSLVSSRLSAAATGFLTDFPRCHRRCRSILPVALSTPNCPRRSTGVVIRIVSLPWTMLVTFPYRDFVDSVKWLLILFFPTVESLFLEAKLSLCPETAWRFPIGVTADRSLSVRATE